MNLKSLLLLFSILIAWNTKSQTWIEPRQLNLGFEYTNTENGIPQGWLECSQGYTARIDSTVKHNGRNALLITSGEHRAEGDYGCMMNSIPATFEGQEIELRAYIKFKDVANGPVDLLLRIDGESGPLQYNNLQEQNIMGTADWTLYSLKLIMPAKARMIYFMPLLMGDGQMWVDDLELLVDGKDISKTIFKPIPIPKAELDHAFDTTSGIKSLNLTGTKLTDMVLLGKIWGFLKYYHPQVAEGNYNWDYELFRIIPKIQQCKSPVETKAILSDWVKNIGLFEKDNNPKIPQKVKLNPDLTWINTQVLGDKLYNQLIDIQQAKRSGENYYISLAEGVGNPEFPHENAYINNEFPDAGYRMLALFRYWNIIQYYYPNRHLIDGSWHGILDQYIPKLTTAKDALEYRLALLSLIGRISDTHANIWDDPYLEKYYGLNFAPIKVLFVGNAVVVSDFDPEWIGKTGLKRGDIIESINEKKLSEIIKERLPITPASNYPTQLRELGETIFRTNDTVMTIGYKRNGKVQFIKVDCYPADGMHIHTKFRSTDTCFKLLPDKIAYLYPGTIKNDYLPTIMSEVEATKGLIIDLRCYPSDFIVHNLCQYLLPKTELFCLYGVGSIFTPGLFTMRDSGFTGEENISYYKGKVIVLVNEYTQSTAEFTVLALKKVPGLIVIGSTTAGADGNVSGFYLPGNVYTQLSGIGIYYPDGKETQRVGIIPDIIVKPTVEGIANRKDELMEKAILLIKQN